MITAMVVGTHRGTIDLLHRRVGGILKDIAKVETCWFEDLDRTNAQIYVCYKEGVRYTLIDEKFKNTDKKVIGADLTLLPLGVKMINSLPKGSTLGVLSEHLRCANYFLGEILQSGVLDYKFLAAPFNEMKSMNVDYFVMPEESMDLIKKSNARNKKILPIPRTITPMCAAQLINSVLD